MNVNSLKFPCACKYRDTTFYVRDADSLTTTTAAALRQGLFDRLTIIDSTGSQYRVVSAKKLGGVGPFFGYNIFLNQRIRVALSLESVGRTYSLDEIRSLVLADLKTWHGWNSRGDAGQVKNEVMMAASIPAILEIVTRH